MNLLGLKIISLTGNNMYSTMVTYQKHFQSSEMFHKDQFSVQHCSFSILTTLITVYTILVLSSMLTIIYVSGNDSESIQKKLNADNLEVHNWLTDNDLSLNLKKVKTKTMIFGTSIRVKKAAPLNIQIKGTSINQTPWYKYLRNHLDSTLQMNGNFNSKYKKLSSRSRLLSKLRPDLNVKASK